MSFFLSMILFGACQGTCDSECLLTPAPSVERPVEIAEVVGSVASVDVSVKASKRVGTRRDARVVARLERRLAKHKSA
jgi:hypothetical protein